MEGVIDHILDNKEWLFSGAGISGVLFIFGIIRRIRRKYQITKYLSTTVSVGSFRDFDGYNDNSDKPDWILEYRLVGDAKIQPYLPYIEKIKKEERIEGNRYSNTPFFMALPSFLVDIVNENEIPVLIKGFTFKVVKSARVLNPIPIFRIAPNPFQILIENQGTSPMKNVRIGFCVSTKGGVEEKGFELNFNYDSITDYKVIDVADHLASQGVDVRYLSEDALFEFMSAREVYRSEQSERKKEEVKANYDRKIASALGPYADLVGLFLAVNGKLIYEDNGKRVSLPFTTYTCIRRKLQAPPPLSASCDVEFKVTSGAYTIPFEFVHELKPKSAHRFRFNLSSTCWSRYAFSLEASTNHGVKRIPGMFELEIFLPRNPLVMESNQREFR